MAVDVRVMASRIATDMELAQMARSRRHAVAVGCAIFAVAGIWLVVVCILDNM